MKTTLNIGDTVNRKIGRNKGKPRLWIEGAALIAAGFKPGDRYTFRPTDDGRFTATRHPEGERKVSGKGDKPIMDISASGLGTLQTAESVDIFIGPAALLVTGIYPAARLAA